MRHHVPLYPKLSFWPMLMMTKMHNEDLYSTPPQLHVQLKLYDHLCRTTTKSHLYRVTFMYHQFYIGPSLQQRQSSLKSWGSWIRVKKFDFSRQISKKFFFQAISRKISIFPGKFLKNFDFSRQIFEKIRFFQENFEKISIFSGNL